MHARVPQDVDFEDRIVLGLTAVRFGELAGSVLAAVTAWRAVPLVGGALAVLCVATGAGLAWARWRGRSADHWVASAGRYWWRNYTVVIDRRRGRGPGILARVGPARPRADLRIVE